MEEIIHYPVFENSIAILQFEYKASNKRSNLALNTQELINECQNEYLVAIFKIKPHATA